MRFGIIGLRACRSSVVVEIVSDIGMSLAHLRRFGQPTRDHQLSSPFRRGRRRRCLSSLIVELKWRVSKTAREWTMRMPVFCAAVLAYVVIGHPPSAVAQVDQQRAQEYFKEAQALCERDGGRLWGCRSARPW